MKKTAQFFALPAIVMIIMVLWGNNFIFKGAEFCYTLFAADTEAENVSTPSQDGQGVKPNQPQFASPFADFSLPSPTPPTYDTDYPIAEL
ncbi:MAG: hypothetical protein RR162_06790, partial [Oscillospiraceae bacterium]